MLTYFILTGILLLAALSVCLCIFLIHALTKEYRGDRVPALLYHQFISKAKVDKGELASHERVYVTYDTSFEEQMRFLHQQGYTTITLDEFLAIQDGRKALPPRPIMLTFDDGFMSNYLYAFPTLKRYGMKATLFVTPDRKSHNFKKYAETDAPLTTEQIKEMSENGISIESHGMTHRYLTPLSPDTIRWELQESKKVLEDWTGKSVRFLAVPSGAYNRTVRRIAKECGYKAVFCMLKGTNNKQSDRFALRRLVVARDFALTDFQKILTPATATHLRLTSSLQNLLLRVLGPSGLDTFRDFLYRSPLGPTLVGGQMRYFAGGLAAAIVIILLLGSLILSH